MLQVSWTYLEVVNEVSNREAGGIWYQVIRTIYNYWLLVVTKDNYWLLVVTGVIDWTVEKLKTYAILLWDFSVFLNVQIDVTEDMSNCFWGNVPFSRLT